MELSSGSINATKLFWPPKPEDFVSRRRLEAQLELILHRPLALVSAPAGYGKSTTVSVWLQEQDVHRAWLSLDKEDDHLPVFLTLVLTAIQKAVPGFAADLLPMVRDSGVVSVSTFITLLDTELDKLARDVVVVLDDFQFIQDPDILQTIQERMRHPHPAMHLVLLTRHDPGLPLVHWRARNQLVDVRSGGLRFTADETAEFLWKATGQKPAERTIRLLQESTEGWAAALRLATLSHDLIGPVPEDGVVSWSMDRDMMNYLASQVLSRLSPEKQAFLLQTSILERMSGPLCDAVIMEGSEAGYGQAMLEEISRENLFVVPLSHNSEWVRYHHLFQEFLRERLVREYASATIKELHKRAAQWFARKDLIVDAIRHALVAGFEELAVELVAEHRHDLMLEDRWYQLDTWFHLFPERVVNNSPDLLLIKGWTAHFRRFDTRGVREATLQVRELLENVDLDDVYMRQLEAENDILRSLVHYFELNPNVSSELCQRSLQVLPRKYYIARSYAWLFWAASVQMSGDLFGALDIIQQGQREDLAFPGSPRARSIAGAGFIYWMAADLEGVKHVGQNLARSASLDMQPQILVWGHYFLASAHYCRNELDEALAHAQYTFNHRFAVHAHCALHSGYIIALTYLAMGDRDKTAETLNAMGDYVLAVRSEPLSSLLQAMQADLALRGGEAREAAHWAHQALGRLTLAAQPLFFAPYLTVPKTLLALDDPDLHPELRDCLQRLYQLFESTHNTRFLIEILALEAMFHDAQGREEEACELLKRALSLAEPSNFVRLFVDLGPQMKGLLARYARHSEEDEFVSLVRAAFQPTVIPASNEALIEPLTDRESEVLELLARRLSNKEIAQELVIAEATVKRHTINIYQKLGVNGRREAVVSAESLGLLD